VCTGVQVLIIEAKMGRETIFGRQLATSGKEEEEEEEEENKRKRK
jgi:hypothetical protein